MEEFLPRSRQQVITLLNKQIKALGNQIAESLKSEDYQKHKPYKVMMTACMRKLLVILNTLVKNNSMWNPQYV